MSQTTSETVVASTPVPEQLSAGKMLSDNLMLLALLFGIFYFILIRPQQKRVKDHEKMIGSLEKGNRVITSGGLIGTIIKFDGDSVAVVEISQGVRVRIAKSAITEVTNEKPNPSDSANDN